MDTADSTVQIVRVLWVGASAPDPSQSEKTFSTDQMDVCSERIEDLSDALACMEKEKWDATIVDQADLPEPPLACLQRLAASGGSGEIILLLDPETPLSVVAGWVDGTRRLRLLLKPFLPSALLALFNQMITWRTEVAGQQEAEPSAWINMELARLTKQATVDQLTGLLRREELIRRSEEEFNRACRTGQHLICILADIDHFKRVNDLHGHQMGDLTLKRVASLLNMGRRGYDLVGRMGGEEFMMIMPGPTLEVGRAIAERMRIRLQDHPWDQESLPGVTISLGVAELQAGDFHDFIALSRAADVALYEAKHHGRNQVRVLQSEKSAEMLLGKRNDERPSLLLVDDALIYLNELSALLGSRYQVEATTSPQEALARAGQHAFDMVLTDENMPDMKGHELLAAIKTLQPDCVRIIMTSHGELSSAIQAINEAAVNHYVLKPWHDEDLILLVHQALESRALVRRLHEADHDMVKDLADMIELKDRSTQGHYHRVAEFCLLIGKRLKYSPERLRMLEYAAWLHDIGKIGIPDEILKKQSPLSSQEEKILREHALIGSSLIGEVEHLRPIAPHIRHHHERFDGHGYPEGLIGPAIPEESRIVAIANAYDGLLTPRRGRSALLPKAAMSQILLGKGSLFDPLLADIFAEACQARSASSSRQL